MQTKRYWLDYDPVALAVLVIGIGAIELLAFSFCPRDLRFHSISRNLAPSLISSIGAKSAAQRRAGLRACGGRVSAPLAHPTASPSHAKRTAQTGGSVCVTLVQLSPWSSLTQKPPVVEPKASRSPPASRARAWRYTIS